MAKKNKLKGKFVVAWDTVVDGNQCMMTEENGKEVPLLFDSYDEAFKELFDGALSMLESRTKKELKEYNEGVTPALVKRMREAFDTGNVELMKIFLDANPECNDGEEWVESAETFMMNRKTFFTGKGVEITGKKLK